MSQPIEQAKSNLFSIARSFRDNHYHDDFSYQRFYAFKAHSDKIFTDYCGILFAWQIRSYCGMIYAKRISSLNWHDICKAYIILVLA